MAAKYHATKTLWLQTKVDSVRGKTGRNRSPQLEDTQTTVVAGEVVPDDALALLDDDTIKRMLKAGDLSLEKPAPAVWSTNTGADRRYP